MFKMLVDGIGAFNQVGLLIGALGCAALGAVLLGNALYWRLHAVRVQGEVIGVRQRGNMFRSVYRYTLPSGQSAEATSSEGSSSLRGRDTGAPCPLLIIPERPDEVHEARSHVWTVVGAVLLSAGLWLFHVAITAWRVGPMTFVIGGIFLAHMAVRLRRLVAPVEKRLGTAGSGMAGWRAALAQRSAADLDSCPILHSEEIRAAPEWRANEQKRLVMRRRFSPVLLGLGVAMLALGGYLGRSLVRLESTGLRVPGIVRALVVPNPGSKGAAYYPEVSFTATDGRRIEFRDSTGSNPPSFHPGETVTVLYSPGDLGHAVIDRGVMNWLPPVAILLFGALLFIAGIRSLRTRTNDP